MLVSEDCIGGSVLMRAKQESGGSGVCLPLWERMHTLCGVRAGGSCGLKSGWYRVSRRGGVDHNQGWSERWV